MRVLVTGGAGFIGSHIVEALVGAGHDVCALDDLSSGKRENLPAGVRLAVVDLRERDAVRRVLLRERPDAVSHQAAQASVSVSVSEPLLDCQVNLVGGLHLLDACVEANVRKLVFASTGGAIYGEVSEGQPATESTVPSPESPYAIHKYAFERLLAVYGRERGLDARILRYANVYGPRQDPHGESGVVAIFFAAALAGKPLRLNARKHPGDGGCIRDYVYVGDVARMNLLALEGRVPEAVVNVGTGVPTTTLALARAIFAVADRAVPIEDAPPRPGDLGVSLLEPTLARRHLGALCSLEEGLGLTCSALGIPARSGASTGGG